MKTNLRLAILSPFYHFKMSKEVFQLFHFEFREKIQWSYHLPFHYELINNNCFKYAIN